MKALKSMATVMGIALLMTLPFMAIIGFKALSGTSTDVSSLGVFGPNATFTCEWKSEDGQQAIFTSLGGSRRFIDLSQRHIRVDVGTQYRLKSHRPHPWITKVYLVPA